MALRGGLPPPGTDRGSVRACTGVVLLRRPPAPRRGARVTARMGRRDLVQRARPPAPAADTVRASTARSGGARHARAPRGPGGRPATSGPCATQPPGLGPHEPGRRLAPVRRDPVRLPPEFAVRPGAPQHARPYRGARRAARDRDDLLVADRRRG